MVYYNHRKEIRTGRRQDALASTLKTEYGIKAYAGGVYLKGCAVMDKLWNARTCRVYCNAWDAYESRGYDYDAAETVFERELQRGVISAQEYNYLKNLFWDTVNLC